MAQFRIGGVPEHFNVPWKMSGTDAEFHEVREGSGAMLRGLAEGKYDGIVALTECVVAEAYKDGSSSPDHVKIVGNYVASELVWGVHVGGKSEISTLADLRGKRFGVSRMGSGSHVMACVMAKSFNWEEGLEFVVIGGFSELREAVNSGKCDAFMWEKFMTKPFHDSGVVRRVGEVPTPWPCFVLAMRSDFHDVQGMKNALSTALVNAKTFKANENNESVVLISDRFGLKAEDAAQWLQAVQYPESTDCATSSEVLESAFNALMGAGVIAKDCVFDSLKLSA